MVNIAIRLIICIKLPPSRPALFTRPIPFINRFVPAVKLYLVPFVQPPHVMTSGAVKNMRTPIADVGDGHLCFGFWGRPFRRVNGCWRRGFFRWGRSAFRLCSCTLAGGACCTTAGCGAGGGVLAVFPPQPKMAAIRAAKMDRRRSIWFLWVCSAWHPPLLLSRKYIIQSPESAYSHYNNMILC